VGTGGKMIAICVRQAIVVVRTGKSTSRELAGAEGLTVFRQGVTSR